MDALAVRPSKDLNEENTFDNKIKNLIISINENDKETFFEQISSLSKFTEQPDILKEISKLGDIVKESGYGKDYMNQLNYISTFMDARIDKYVPINKKFKNLYNGKKKQKGISFLCDAIDKSTGGMVAPALSVFMGGSGCMKTTYAVNVCYNAIKEGKNVAYLSLEESPQQLYSKLLSRVSVDVGKPLLHKDIIQHKLSEYDEKALFEDVLPYLENLPGNFFIVGEGDFISYDTYDIENKLREVDKLMKEESKHKNQEDDHGIDIVVVDHIQLLKYSGDIQYENSIINKYVSFFRQQSLSFLHQKREIIIILLSQVNREGLAYASKDKHYGEYLMQHIGEASEIERSASYIITVYSNATEQLSKKVKIGTLKLRGSQLLLGVLNVIADGEHYHVGDAPIKQNDYSINDLNLQENSNLSFENNLDDILKEFNL